MSPLNPPGARLARFLAGCVALLLLCACSREQVHYGVDGGQWRSYAGDPGSAKYSPLDRIRADNVGELEIAWIWSSADVRWKERLDASSPLRRTVLSVFQGTPLMVDGVLYGITSVGQVYALDAGSGEERWVYDPKSILSRVPNHRGVTYWRDGDDERIFVPTGDAWLLALDAATGRPVASFGASGRVDLLEGLRYTGAIERQRDYNQTSPAALYRNTLIVGSSIGDRPRRQRGIPGDVRGYDTHTGALKWVFHTIPARGETGVETWQDGAWKYTGAANAWGPMSVDPVLGFVYVSTSTPTNDYYGGHRLGDNLFAETLLCLNAETGARIWHQQLVRHGLWDYDLAAAANLVDITVDGRPIAAVAQVTKQAFAFVFDRVTGEPVWPIENRAVPASDVPGERAAATQRFPTKPPPFDRQGTTEDDLIDFTPELRAEALALFRRYRTGPLFTPPSLEGTLTLPAPNGGASWTGAGVDRDSGILYVSSITETTLLSVRLGKPGRSDLRYLTHLSRPMTIPEGTIRLRGGLPITKPPYSRITAIDLNRGEIIWQVPNGDGPRHHPRLADLDLLPLGSGGHACVLVTKSLLLAAVGGASRWAAYGDPLFRAYDKRTGALIGEVALPGPVRGCPMTYLHDGVQYVVLPVSSTARGPELVALALGGEPTAR